MKKTFLVVVLALVLTFTFVAGAYATTGKFFANSTSYYQWNKPAVIAPGTASPAGLYNIGDNPTNPGAHANYLATTAKCGLCHSVHRAVATGTKLLPTADATCAGCHTGTTAITAKIVTWTPYDVNWTPTINPASPLAPIGSAAWNAATGRQRSDALTAASKAAAGGAANGGGPHNDSALDLIADGIWDGTGATPEASYEVTNRYGCFTRRCHATNPHGAGGSQYKIFAAKLLFNLSANNDQEGDGTYGGLDAVYDDLGATDASVQRFIDANPLKIRAALASTAGVEVDTGTGWREPDANEKHALVAGLTCGRPSNPSTGEDECHAEAVYAVFDKAVKEARNHATGITAGSAYRTDNTGAEAAGYGGNDNRDNKTGHVAGTFAAQNGAASYVPIAGCTSCHDQTDAGNTVYGHFTFPHGQVAYGGSNLSTDGVTPLPANPYDPAKLAFDTANPSLPNRNAPRSRIWAGYGGTAGAQLTYTAGTNQKAYDGQCLKCHRSVGAASGIGIDF